MSYRIDSPLNVAGTGSSPGEIILSDGSFGVNLKAPDALTGDVDFVLPDTAGTSGQVLARDATGGTEWISGGGGGANPAHTIPFVLQMTNPRNGFPTRSRTLQYVSFSHFIYKGTAADSPISAMKAIVSSNSVGITGNIRLFDATNGVVLSTTSFTTTTTQKVVIDLSPVTNLPVSEAHIEVQINRSSGEFYMWSLSFYG